MLTISDKNDWLLTPPLLAFKQRRYWYWYYTQVQRIRKFKNIHAGEDCFIIGNGPSLNKMDLERLNSYHTFGMNKIYLIFERVNLQLSYLVAVNSLVIEQSKDVYEKIDTPVFLSYKNSKNVIANKPNIYRLFTKYPEDERSWYFSSTLEKPIYEGCTVTFVTLQIAFYMGFRRVFLVGVDHNFVQKGKPHEQQIMKEEDVNHFDPNYFKGNAWHLADLEGSEVSYQLAKYAYYHDGREIFDATVDGKLQVFNKISYERALALAKPKR